MPSSGIIPPVPTVMQSPGRTSPTGTRIEPESVSSQTLSMLSDIDCARSATDFLCVHSSRMSPMPSRNIIEPAVSKSPRSIETVIAVASSTGTCILPCSRQRSPAPIYFAERMTDSAVRSGVGKKSFVIPRRNTAKNSLS